MNYSGMVVLRGGDNWAQTGMEIVQTTTIRGWGWLGDIRLKTDYCRPSSVVT